MSRRTNGQATAYMRARGAPMVEVSLDMLDIARRLQEGDEFWRGDPTMELCWNEYTRMFQVIAIDGRGQPYVAAQSETCDQQLLVALAESDWQRGARAMVAEAVRREEAARKAAETVKRDLMGEAAEKAAWGIKRALAQHLGGRSFSYSMNTPGRR